MNTKLLIVGILLAGGLYYWFSTQGSMTNTEMTSSTAPVSASPSSATTAATVMTDTDVKVFTLEAGSFYYKPNVINVKKGDKVKAIMNSVDMMHDFVIDELNIKSAIAKSGSSAEVEFTADKVGSFEFYCSVGSHRKMGMVGTLVVTE